MAEVSSSATRCAGLTKPTDRPIPTSPKLSRATVDVGAVIDFASSFGTLVLTRAYADWSAPVNADYRGQLVSRAVDLVQLFPTAAYAKNGADIRLAVDAVEDMFRLPDLTHIVIVAGTRITSPWFCVRRLAGTSSAAPPDPPAALAAACDELVIYDALPGITSADVSPQSAAQANGAQAQRAQSGSAAPARSSRRTKRPPPAALTRATSTPKTRKKWRLGSWIGRCGSARTRMTRTGRIARR